MLKFHYYFFVKLSFCVMILQNAKSFNQNLDSWNVDSLEMISASAFQGSAMENNPPKWFLKFQNKR